MAPLRLLVHSSSSSSTYSKLIFFFLFLFYLPPPPPPTSVPVSEIVGNPDIFVRSGAPINVTCLISSSPAPPAFVFWYHNNRMINYDYGGGNSGGGSGGQEGASGGTSGGSGGRGQISVAKDPNRADVVISRLLIRSAVLDDSGNYTCSPSNAEPASTYVHVLQGTDN